MQMKRYYHYIYLVFFLESPNWDNTILHHKKCILYIHVDNWRRGSSRPDQVHQVIMISLKGMTAKITMTMINNCDNDNNDQVQVHQVVTGMSW